MKTSLVFKTIQEGAQVPYWTINYFIMILAGTFLGFDVVKKECVEVTL